MTLDIEYFLCVVAQCPYYVSVCAWMDKDSVMFRRCRGEADQIMMGCRIWHTLQEMVKKE